MNRENGKKVLVVVGPTGIGKTSLSILLSEYLDLEIVSADSRQIFKYMDIGTAKPPADILNKIPHHFISMLEPDERYSAGQFGLDSRTVIREIRERERVPLVVGGSGLYVKALTDGFFRRDVHDPGIRKELQDRLEKEGASVLYSELSKADPESAGKIHPNNVKRIIRSLEVYLASGEKLSELQRHKVPTSDFKFLKFGLIMERKHLYRKIDERVEKMFQQGLVAEVSAILEKGFDKNLNSLNSVGYKEVILYLEGKMDLATCMEEVKKNSRRYAKRQLTWFRADDKISWFMVQDEDALPEIAARIMEKYDKTVRYKVS